MNKPLAVWTLAIMTIGAACAQVQLTVDATPTSDPVKTKFGYIIDWSHSGSDIWNPQTKAIRGNAKAILDQLPGNGVIRFSGGGIDQYSWRRGVGKYDPNNEIDPDLSKRPAGTGHADDIYTYDYNAFGTDEFMMFLHANFPSAKPLFGANWWGWNKNPPEKSYTYDPTKGKREAANWADATANRFQDWEAWLRAGILDFAIPMNFAIDNRVFQAKCAETGAISTGRAIYMGQGGWKMPAAKALEQIKMARQGGFGGIVVYSYAYCSKPNGEQPSLMDQLKTGPFGQADAPPAMSWK